MSGSETAEPCIVEKFGECTQLGSDCKRPECVTFGALKTTNLFMKLKCQVHIYST